MWRIALERKGINRRGRHEWSEGVWGERKMQLWINTGNSKSKGKGWRASLASSVRGEGKRAYQNPKKTARARNGVRGRKNCVLCAALVIGESRGPIETALVNGGRARTQWPKYKRRLGPPCMIKGEHLRQTAEAGSGGKKVQLLTGADRSVGLEENLGSYGLLTSEGHANKWRRATQLSKWGL